jgi:hypothetical protein
MIPNMQKKYYNMYVQQTRTDLFFFDGHLWTKIKY